MTNCCLGVKCMADEICWVISVTWSRVYHSSRERVKGTIKWSSIPNFTFCWTPQIFLHIQRELHCNSLPIQQFSRKPYIFGKRENSLLLGIIFASENKFKPVFLVGNHLNFYFLKFRFIFPFGMAMFTFLL